MFHTIGLLLSAGHLPLDALLSVFLVGLLLLIKAPKEQLAQFLRWVLVSLLTVVVISSGKKGRRARAKRLIRLLLRESRQ